MKLVFSILIFCCLTTKGFAQKNVSHIVRYSPAWFGPNANPVPEITEARIPNHTEFLYSTDYSFGFGDNTINQRLQIEVPFIPSKVSVKLWNTFLEFYDVSEPLARKRGMINNSGMASGDFYFQTNFLILDERKNRINLLGSATLKTASGTDFWDRRYFDSPGYIFSLEGSKAWPLTDSKSLPPNFRLSGILGFLCWATESSTQNDALVYGISGGYNRSNLQLFTSISGYWGWMHTHPSYGADYGDAPVVWTNRVGYNFGKTTVFSQYVYGIQDFPYHQVRLGVRVGVEKLTPRY